MTFGRVQHILFFDVSLVYTIGLALLDFNNRAKKLSYLALFKVHLFLTVFQRRLSADKSPQYPKGQAFRLYLFCRSVKDSL